MDLTLEGHNRLFLSTRNRKLQDFPQPSNLIREIVYQFLRVD